MDEASLTGRGKYKAKAWALIVLGSLLLALGAACVAESFIPTTTPAESLRATYPITGAHLEPFSAGIGVAFLSLGIPCWLLGTVALIKRA